MQVSEQEKLELKEFIFQLNAIKNDVVIVEGKRDSDALRKIGHTGKILEFHRFTGMINFTDSVAKFERLIILFDRDKKGRMLIRKTIQLLKKDKDRSHFQKEITHNYKRKNNVYQTASELRILFSLKLWPNAFLIKCL